MKTTALYPNDSKAEIFLSEPQIETISEIKKLISEGKLKLIKNSCLCNNMNPEKDYVLAEKDRYGLPIASVICSKCGLVRSDEIFSEESNMDFYKNHYRLMYTGLQIPSMEFYNNQAKTGSRFLRLIESKVDINSIDKIVEIGCGAGGILSPFKMSGKEVRGFDYNDDYLAFGNSQGLNLIKGDYNDFLENEEVDLVILSHVMEHFINPIGELKTIINKIKKGKYLLVEVPGIFSIKKEYHFPIRYFQNAHVYNYYGDYLKVFFESLGLKVIYGDEKCLFLCQKPLDYQETKIAPVYDANVMDYQAKKIKAYFISANRMYKYYLNPYMLKAKFMGLLSKK